ncbi:histidine phosphatase family protein [Fictibacillus fluitans]|uniref:Histidine phosphatase family protein n=1 Tax=Fictibacillus fluitans TaxID=3058422 RepID=A0ABT8I264_9BACL|nr:histidine phosphatase family protein [Fictibacillus sp. NE201]MDN4527063.1 histidine phosphatase family protein [Fictibacillus sp. NE201]
MTTVAFVRHGQTDWNAAGRIQGIMDIPLNSDGRSQADALAARFKGEQWDFIVTSSLSRARETGEIIAEVLHVPLATDSRIREMNFGRLEGTDEAGRIERWGDNWNKLEHGIEKKEEVLKRGYQFLQELTENHAGKKVMVISHGAFIGTLIRDMMKTAEYEASLFNTSVSILIYREKHWECQLFNCSAHLKASEPMNGGV